MQYLGKKSAARYLQTVLNICWYGGLGILAALVVGVLFFWLFAPTVIPESLNAHVVLHTTGLELRFSSDIVEAPFQPFILWALLLALPLLSVAVYIIHQLRHIFRTLVENDPFVIDNAIRLRRVAIGVLVGAVLQAVAEILVGSLIMKAISIPGLLVNLRIQISVTTVFLGLVLLILAEIFKIGTEIKDEQELTI